ncbi:two-component system, OmpR family, phosphate regulon sensor histidine kinase PhoR [Pilibacter termitis]|uniref:histidine kinase n=1 Tax=Pilibacter termitis TaxID=263852 RepID=A0A1T4M830_9ENTE|nr:ATP-binding protein [Pilibacter termitis]SJZ63071.1 two-component system, OmpR family, phosphate regulon sensor histidine kinase PhoR [Pilibacter termitis]
MLRSKTFREGFSALLVLLLLFITCLLVGNHFFKEQVIHQQTGLLEKKLTLFIDTFPTKQVLEKETLNAEQEKTMADFLRVDQDRLTILLSDGTILFDSAGDKIGTSRKNRPEIQAIEKGANIGTSVRKSPTQQKKDWLYVALPVKTDGKLIGFLRISNEVASFSKAIELFRSYMIGILSVLFIILGISILRLIRQKNEPIEMILPVLKKSLRKPEEVHAILTESKNMQEFYTVINSLNQKMSATYQAYQSTEEQFYQFLQELMIGVFLLKKDGTVLLINPALAQILEVDECKNKHYTQVFAQSELLLLIQQSLQAKHSEQKEIHLSSPERVLDVTLRYIDHTSSELSMIGSAYNLTRVRQLEQMQRDFVGNVSHELKTPVTSLIGFTETLLDGAMEDKELTRQFLEIMQRDAKRLEHLIQEILQLSRGRDTYEGENQEINLKNFLEDLTKSYISQIQEKELQVEISSTSTSKPCFSTKPALFQPIVKNLFENAIQYSKEKGKIELHFSIDETSLTLSIKDNGIGIDLENQKRIFERFYRVDKARTRYSGGTGLGLSIVKNYVDLLGGTIELNSQVGVGTEFVVKL